MTPRRPRAARGAPLATARRGVARIAPGLGVATALAVAASVIADRTERLSPLVIALGLGLAVGNLVRLPPATAPGLAVGARRLLRVGVVLLGLRLAVGDVVDVGAPGLVVVVGVVVATFAGTRWLGRRLGIDDATSTLVATGYAICGVSAIAAMSGTIDAGRRQIAAAVGLVTLFGSLAVVVLPMVGTAAGVSDDAFGAWAGASVHDVGQVVATAGQRSDDALAAAVVVKLTRVVLLAPLVAGVGLAVRRRTGATTDGDTHVRIVPLFVVGFLAMVALRSTGVVPDDVLDAAHRIETWALTAAMAAIGTGVRVAELRGLGLRLVVLGTVAWVLVAAVAAGGVALTR